MTAALMAKLREMGWDLPVSVLTVDEGRKSDHGSAQAGSEGWYPWRPLGILLLASIYLVNLCCIWLDPRTKIAVTLL